MTNLDKYGLRLSVEDLSTLTPDSDDDGRIFLHDGTSALTLTDATTSSKEGHYMWDQATTAWRPLMHDADTVDGKHASDFAPAVHDHDTRYYTRASADSTFVDAAGDTMTGSLSISGAGLTVTGPDDASGTVSFTAGADTATAGTPSMTVDLAGSDLTDGLTSIWDAASSHVPSASVQGLDTHTASTTNPHGVTAAQAGAYTTTESDGRFYNEGQDLTGTNRVGGGNGFYFDFNNSTAWVELVDGAGARTDLVTSDVYINEQKAWLDSWMTGIENQLSGYDLQKDGTDGTGVINFKTV